MDSFFGKGFKAAKCKTLLKLTIPRIKLLRNRREIQIKQMRREIAKLLETGQEATARIRVEHIIREEKMMAAQEIVELFCELISVRLPIIEVQRECPLDLKEAISSVCFAAPRCADLPELLQVQMLFAGKYGKEFVSAATELMPECGVNRQLVELLSVRAPAPDVKMKLLKEIAEEHELDWDPSASETELLKPHEDLLNGPTQFVSGSKVPLPDEKHEEPAHSNSGTASNEQVDDSDAGFDFLDFPDVPNQPLRSSKNTVTAPEMLPFPASALSDGDHESSSPDHNNILPRNTEETPDDELDTGKCESPGGPGSQLEERQFVPFISPPSQTPPSLPVKENNQALPISRTKSGMNVDLQDVLAAAQAAAESAERAAAAARAAASLAQLRISELAKNKNDEGPDGSSENPFHGDKLELQEKPSLSVQSSSNDLEAPLTFPSPRLSVESHLVHQASNLVSHDNTKGDNGSSIASDSVPDQPINHQQPQRLPSMDDETYFSYPNLFSHGSKPVSRVQSFTDDSRTMDK